MRITIHPGKARGQVVAPASKSSMQRACAAALLRQGSTVLHNPGHSHDDLSALETIVKLGASVETETKGNLLIRSQGVRPVGGEINCGESGLGVRMFTPIAALSDQPLEIRGKGSLLSRPLDFFDEVFPQLGIVVRSDNGRLPLHIQGPMQPGDITVDGSLSSQFLTGLLMAYAAAGANGKTIRVRNLTSKPYIDLTLDVLGAFGWQVTHDGYEVFHFNGYTPPADPFSYTVEGDWSGGAFLLVAGAIAGPIEVKGLDLNSTQADRAVLRALGDAEGLRPFRFDATDCPDLFPPLVALAAYCEGASVIAGANRLRHKESDRAATLSEEFGKLGIRIEVIGDEMRVHGGTGVRGAQVASHNDHRIAMACAVAALGASGPVHIEGAQAVGKSYTDFFQDLQALGIRVEEQLKNIPS